MTTCRAGGLHKPLGAFYTLSHRYVELSATCGSCPTATNVATAQPKPSPVGEGGSRRLTDEVFLTQNNPSVSFTDSSPYTGEP